MVLCFRSGEAVYARCLSSLKSSRVLASEQLQGPADAKFEGDKKEYVEHIRKVYSYGILLLSLLRVHWLHIMFSHRIQNLIIYLIAHGLSGAGTTLMLQLRELVQACLKLPVV